MESYREGLGRGRGAHGTKIDRRVHPCSGLFLGRECTRQVIGSAPKTSDDNWRNQEVELAQHEIKVAKEAELQALAVVPFGSVRGRAPG